MPRLLPRDTAGREPPDEHPEESAHGQTPRSRTMPRTRQEIDRAIRQVTRDGPVPLADLAAASGVTVQTLERWVRHGREGVFLQAIRRGSEWLSSPQAVARFVAELARAEEQEGEDLEQVRARSG